MDRDNDKMDSGSVKSKGRENCAISHGGGFWFKSCLQVNPTGRYYNGGYYTSAYNDGIQWRSWPLHGGKEGMWYSMKTLHLMIRPIY